jgi:hypothetical protein
LSEAVGVDASVGCATGISEQLGSTTSLDDALLKKLVSFPILLAVSASSFSFSRFRLAGVGTMILSRPPD